MEENEKTHMTVGELAELLKILPQNVPISLCGYPPAQLDCDYDGEIARIFQAVEMTQVRALDHETFVFCLTMWRAGMPVHDHMNDECCPDFSCCSPKLLTKPDEKRHVEADRILRGYEWRKANNKL